MLRTEKIMNKDVLYQWATDLFPLCRSITGAGVRETLDYIKNIVPELKIHSMPSGTAVFDWIVPPEWNCFDAYIENSRGERILDFKANNLHVLSYSEPVNAVLEWYQLKDHLHTLPDNPDAIPYNTSYYKKKWGFCMSYNQKMRLSKTDLYRVFINSELKKDGCLNYGEIIIKGATDREILLSTYICHPSLANDNLSGIIVTTAIAKFLLSIKNRHYTYRILYLPETIGAIAYLSRNISNMQNKTDAGFVITCCGDENNYSFIPSRSGNTLSDKIARFVLNDKKYTEYSFLDRGSDERQFCSPRVNLPVASIMRSKYAEYKEYHNSLDNLSFISAQGLFDSYIIYNKCIDVLELNCTPITVNFCEPMLSKYDLYPGSRNIFKDILAYADGKTDLLTMSILFNVSFNDVVSAFNILLTKKLIEVVL